jgi:hypothetical protein
MFLVVEQGVWRDVEEVNIGVVSYESILEKTFITTVVKKN